MEPDLKPAKFTRSHALVLLYTTFGLMAWISWRRWPDLLMDYWLNLYIPWRVLEGDILYRDFHFLFGPIIPHIHAGLFQLFGTGMMTLVGYNLILILAFIYLLFVIFEKLADRFTATLCCLTFILVFCFAHYISGSNNYVAPYVYEVTQGIMLGTLGVFLFEKYLSAPDTRKLTGLGLILGLGFMIKAEIFLAIGASLTTGLLIAYYFKIVPEKPGARQTALFFIAAGSPLILSIIYFSFHMPFGQTVHSLVLPYLYVIDSPMTSLPFYQWVRGTRNLDQSLFRVFVCIGSYLALAAITVSLNHLTRHRREVSRWILIFWGAGLVSLVSLYLTQIPWLHLVSGLQVFLAGYCVVRFSQIRHRVTQGKNAVPVLCDLVLALFSLALLPKVILNVHVDHFSLYLALPGTLLLVKAFAWDLPQYCEKVSGFNRFAKQWFAVLISVIFLGYTLINVRAYQQKTIPVGTGGDRVFDFHPSKHPRASQMEVVLAVLNDQMKPGEHLVTLPVGIYFNYMLRNESPLPMFGLIPFEHFILGETAVVEALKKKPPEWIILREVQFYGLGPEYFGEDYGLPTFHWMKKNYEPMITVGPPPFTDSGYGVQVLRLKQNFTTPDSE